MDNKNLLVAASKTDMSKQGIDLGKVVDLLYTPDGKEYSEMVERGIRDMGTEIGNVGKVAVELYPAGDFPPGKLNSYLCDYRKQEVTVYRTHSYMGDGADVQLWGDKLDKDNPLIIVNKAIRYGRAFAEICEALEIIGRKMEIDANPQTFAFFRYVKSQQGMKILAENVLTRVFETGVGYHPYLPFAPTYFGIQVDPRYANEVIFLGQKK